jgi:hypothetical protein
MATVASYSDIPSDKKLKATYEDIQDLKAEIASRVSEFKAQFYGAEVSVALKCEIITRHGKETIQVKLEDTPAVEQGILPEMNAEEIESTIHRIGRHDDD